MNHHPRQLIIYWLCSFFFLFGFPLFKGPSAFFRVVEFFDFREKNSCQSFYCVLRNSCSEIFFIFCVFHAKYSLFSFHQRRFLNYEKPTFTKVLVYILNHFNSFVKFFWTVAKVDFLQLKISPVMGVILKSRVTGQTIRTPQLPHSETIDIQGFQKLYLVNF